MTRKMLINAQNPEELRIAITSDGNLDAYQIQTAERGLTRGNIYRGRIANIQPSLNAAFIDYGAERQGFLAIQDVVPEAYYKQPKGKGRPAIDEVLEKGKAIVVQVVKEAEGSKGAALTTNLSLAGRYLVLTPFDKTRGVSRKVEDEDVRKGLKKQAAKLEVPAGCGVIVRTNALDQNKTALNRDLSALLRMWKRVGAAARKGKGVQLLYSDQDIILQALRDHLDSSVSEVLVDDEAAMSQAEEYMKAFMPRSKTKLRRYEERTPIFSRHAIEEQIARIYDRTVSLPSGGAIVIDPTEALTAIDVNSGRSTRASTQEETAVNTNVEAAVETARQLRLRDLGGLVVVDFIDMRAAKNRRKIEKAVRDAMKADRARHSIGRISSNGLMEINRQRIQQALHLRTHQPCPTCQGTGHIASAERVGLELLRKIAARAADEDLEAVRIHLHPELADAVQNGRRGDLAELEEEFEIRIEIIASNRLHRRQQEVEWEKSKTAKRRPTASKRRSRSKSRGSSEPATAASMAGALAMSAEEEEEESQDRKPRRRRRGRRGRGRSEDAESTEVTSQDADLEADGDDEDEAPKRRSRSRGGRGRGGRRRTTDDEDASQAASAEDDEDDDSAEDKPPSRRRSRGRRGGRGRRRAAPRTDDEVDDNVAEDGDDDDETPRRRPRRRRTTRSKDAEVDGNVDSDDEDDEAPRRRSRGRRRTTRSRDAEVDGNVDSDDEAPARSRRSRSRRGSAARSGDTEVDGNVDSDDGENDAPRRRGRGRRRSPSRTTEDADGNIASGDEDSGRGRRSRRGRGRGRAAEAEEESPKPSIIDEPWITPDGGDEEPAPRRRRSGRGRSTAKDQEAAAPLGLSVAGGSGAADSGPPTPLADPMVSPLAPPPPQAAEDSEEKPAQRRGLFSWVRKRQSSDEE